jgi:hypothetical protein
MKCPYFSEVKYFSTYSHKELPKNKVEYNCIDQTLQIEGHVTNSVDVVDKVFVIWLIMIKQVTDANDYYGCPEDNRYYRKVDDSDLNTLKKYTVSRTKVFSY